ncbi:hypothetical protein ACWERV_13105 [Streptomyces sp. NPDC004031]
MRLRSMGTIAVGAVAATALAVSPAFATSSAYGVGTGGHSASGSVTWLNRSVGIQGSVTDIGGAGTQVEFDAYAGGSLVDIQTRTAVDEVKSYNFTIDGSAFSGGINEVDIILIDLHTNDVLQTQTVWRQ